MPFRGHVLQLEHPGSYSVIDGNYRGLNNSNRVGGGGILYYSYSKEPPPKKILFELLRPLHDSERALGFQGIE